MTPERRAEFDRMAKSRRRAFLTTVVLTIAVMVGAVIGLVTYGPELVGSMAARAMQAYQGEAQ
jgi:hypothetical protein